MRGGWSRRGPPCARCRRGCGRLPIIRTLNMRPCAKKVLADIRPGFKTDGASIPKFVLAGAYPLLMFFGITRTATAYAAVPHDEYYRKQRDKAVADEIFRELLIWRAKRWWNGFGRRRRIWGAWLAYWAVKYGGAAAYRENGDNYYKAICEARKITYRPFMPNEEHNVRMDELQKTYGQGFWNTDEAEKFYCDYLRRQGMVG